MGLNGIATHLQYRLFIIYRNYYLSLRQKLLFSVSRSKLLNMKRILRSFCLLAFAFSGLGPIFGKSLNLSVKTGLTFANRYEARSIFVSPGRDMVPGSQHYYNQSISVNIGYQFMLDAK